MAARRPLPPDDPTSALLARLADGDRGVSSEFFRALWSPVRRLAGSMLQHEADADDAAQDAMVTIFARASDYDRTRAGAPWALAIAWYARRTLQKKRIRRREDLDAATDVPSDSMPEQESSRRASLLGDRELDDDRHGRARLLLCGFAGASGMLAGFAFTVVPAAIAARWKASRSR